MKPKIAILEKIDESGLIFLKTSFHVNLLMNKSKSYIEKNIHKYDCIVIKSSINVNKAFLKKAKKLKLIARAGTGTDNIELLEAKKRNITIIKTPNLNAVSAAEYTILLILSLCKNLNQTINLVKKNDFRRNYLIGNQLENMNIGIIGLGNVGISVFKRLKSFNCKIYGWDINKKKLKQFKKLGGNVCNSHNHILKVSDIISYHVPLDKTTHKMFGYKELTTVKKGIYIINIARGEVFDNKAIIKGIKRKIIKGVAIDVLNPEPPFEQELKQHKKYKHIFLKNSNILISPHIAALTIEAQKMISITISKEIKNFFNKKR